MNEVFTRTTFSFGENVCFLLKIHKTETRKGASENADDVVWFGCLSQLIPFGLLGCHGGSC